MFLEKFRDKCVRIQYYVGNDKEEVIGHIDSENPNFLFLRERNQMIKISLIASILEEPEVPQQQSSAGTVASAKQLNLPKEFEATTEVAVDPLMDGFVMANAGLSADAGQQKSAPVYNNVSSAAVPPVYSSPVQTQVQTQQNLAQPVQSPLFSEVKTVPPAQANTNVQPSQEFQNQQTCQNAAQAPSLQQSAGYSEVQNITGNYGTADVQKNDTLNQPVAGFSPSFSSEQSSQSDVTDGQTGYARKTELSSTTKKLQTLDLSALFVNSQQQVPASVQTAPAADSSQQNHAQTDNTPAAVNAQQSFFQNVSPFAAENTQPFQVQNSGTSAAESNNSGQTQTGTYQQPSMFDTVFRSSDYIEVQPETVRSDTFNQSLNVPGSVHDASAGVSMENVTPTAELSGGFAFGAVQESQTAQIQPVAESIPVQPVSEAAPVQQNAAGSENAVPAVKEKKQPTDQKIAETVRKSETGTGKTPAKRTRKQQKKDDETVFKSSAPSMFTLIKSSENIRKAEEKKRKEEEKKRLAEEKAAAEAAEKEKAQTPHQPAVVPLTTATPSMFTVKHRAKPAPDVQVEEAAPRKPKSVSLISSPPFDFVARQSRLAELVKAASRALVNPLSAEVATSQDAAVDPLMFDSLVPPPETQSQHTDYEPAADAVSQTESVSEISSSGRKLTAENTRISVAMPSPEGFDESRIPEHPRTSRKSTIERLIGNSKAIISEAMTEAKKVIKFAPPSTFDFTKSGKKTSS